MGMREDIARSFADWDIASTPGGAIHCRYEETYTESLEAQGVDRALQFARHEADEAGVTVGAGIDWIKTRAGEWIPGPFKVETYEPQGRLVVTVRLRYSGG